MIYEIFGKTVEILTQNKDIEHILSEELELYSVGSSEIDIQINFVASMALPQLYSNSPSIHSTFKKGFMGNYGENRIYYSQEDILKVYIDLKIVHDFKSNIHKFRSIGYKSNVENVSAILYELVLVPLNYFFKDKALVHASSMKDPTTGKTIMFGGTGGVGKTSLELLLCRELGYSFISDDIAVMDKKGYIYPNLAYPKIYAYNAEGNVEIENILFENRNFMDKFQWKMYKTLRGPARVRRTISPAKIYNSVEKNKNIVDEYYILSRDSSVDTIEIEEIDSKKASLMTLKIILNEYHLFNQHVTWHEYNSILLDQEPILKLEKVHQNWLNIYEKVFKEKKCFHIKIPIKIDHNNFLETFKKKFANG